MTGAEALRVVVLISGSGTNLQAIIDAIGEDDLAIEIVAVVSDQPDAYGLQRARDAGIAAIPVDFKSFAERQDYDAALEQQLEQLAPDLIVLAGYMRILPANTVNLYAGKMLNVHPSLLPAYPGLNTYARALAAGEDWHGTTVHFVTPELDAGPGILQYRVRIRDGETETELRERVQAGEYIIYPRAIGWIADARIKLEGERVLLDGEPLSAPVAVEEEAC